MLEVFSIQNNCDHPKNDDKNNELNYIIAYTTMYLNMLLACSTERINYQQHLLPPLKQFIKHLYSYTKLSHSVLLVSLIYLERLKHGLPSQSIGEYDTPYKMLIAAIVLASKFIEDSKITTCSIYKILAPLYTASEINDMERSFLAVIKFDLYVNPSQIRYFIQSNLYPFIRCCDEN